MNTIIVESEIEATRENVMSVLQKYIKDVHGSVNDPNEPFKHGTSVLIVDTLLGDRPGLIISGPDVEGNFKVATIFNRKPNYEYARRSQLKFLDAA